MGHFKVLDHGVSSIWITGVSFMSPHNFLWLHKSSSAGLPLLMCWRHWSCTLRSPFTHIRSGLTGMREPSGDQSRGTAFPLPTCPSVLAIGCCSPASSSLPLPGELSSHTEHGKLTFPSAFLTDLHSAHCWMHDTGSCVVMESAILPWPSSVSCPPPGQSSLFETFLPLFLICMFSMP